MPVEIGDEITILRDVDAFLIPSGTPVTLYKGEEVTINQAMGGSYTVYIKGNLCRITAKDADALGAEVSEDVANPTKIYPGVIVTEEEVWAELKTCYDPEIPVNILDLGLIYDMILNPLDDGGYKVYIEMTLTAPGCGMGPIIVQEVHDKVLAIKNIIEVQVELVFDPPWDQSMLSEAAQLQLGFL